MRRISDFIFMWADLNWVTVGTCKVRYGQEWKLVFRKCDYGDITSGRQRAMLFLAELA